MLSEKQTHVKVIAGPFSFYKKDGSKKVLSTCKSVIPEGWYGTIDRNEPFNEHASYIRRALKMMFKDQIAESRRCLSEMAINLRIQRIKQISNK